VPHPALRRLLLAVAVIDDLDLELDDRSLVLPLPGGAVRVRYSSCLAAVGGAPLGGDRARRRLAGWLRLRAALAGHDAADILDSIRPLGLPVGHVLHPGGGFALDHVLGGALDLGAGLLGVDPDREEEVTAVPASMWRALGLDPVARWPEARRLLEAMGGLAAERWRLDPARVLRPMGDCDVVTLLGSTTLRAALAASAGGLCPAVVPMRTRGWTRLSRLDPAFAPAAAAATEATERGFVRPLLVTADEVVLARPGGQPAQLGLADPASRYDLGEAAAF
jgi:hypothetical protein